MYRLIDQGFVSLGNFLTIFLGAIFLSVSDQAILIVAYSTYFVFLLLSVAFTYSPAQIIYSKTKYKNQYISSNFLLHLFVSAIFVVLLYLIYNVFERFQFFIAYKIDIDSVLWFLFFQQIVDYGRRISYVIELKLEPVIISFLSHFLRVVVILVVQPETFNQYFDILLLTALIASGFALYSMFSRLTIKGLLKCLHLIRYQIYFSRNLLSSTPIAWLISYFPIYLSGVISGAQAVAVLGTLKSLTNLANLFVELIETSQIPRWSKEKNVTRIKKLFLPSMINIIIAFTVFWCFTLFVSLFIYEPLINIFNTKYSNTLNIFVLLWCSYLFYFYSRIVIIAYRLEHNTKIELMYSLVVLACAVPISLIIFNYFKLDGVLGGALIYFLLPLLGSIWLIYKFFYNSTVLKRIS